MQENTDKLIVLWTSRDKETAENMVFICSLFLCKVAIV